jgi:imidazolonepropionase-like amidohydrolase
MSWLKDAVPAAELAKIQAGATDRPPAQQAFGIQARNLARLNKAGVRITMGTDGGIVWSHHVEMADMVAAGMTPSQVIVSATKSAAEFLRLADEGTIASGKSADFIVLDGNPLEDITNTRKISSAHLRGAAVDRAALRARMMK